MNDAARILAIAVASFLVGSVPFAYIVGKVFFRTDIREHGSGNVGTTNVYRTFGPLPAIGVLLLDALKGWVPVSSAALLVTGQHQDLAMVVASLCAIAGHTFTPFLGFSGGKGIATAAGALLRLTPMSWAVMMGVFLILVLPTGIISLGSVVIAALYPVSVYLFYPGRDLLLAFAVVVSAMVLLRHRANIRRLFRGEEKRLRPGSWRAVARGRDGGGSEVSPSGGGKVADKERAG
ncbi:MAG: glycerol-3-phosphate 1-O-acyltransferase PlsY [Coriobacteriia bacterium]